MKRPLERTIQADIEAAIGAEPDLLLLRNANGVAQCMSKRGEPYVLHYGLGDGSPDLVGILTVSGYGTWFCLEVKRPGERAEPHQTKCHAQWARFGAFVAVVHSVDEARDALQRARRGEQRYAAAQGHTPE